MTFPQFPVEFTKDGTVWDEAQVQALLGGLPACSDLIVLTHGWNHDMAKANDLYDRLTQSIEVVLGLDEVPGLKGRTINVLRVYWPSKRFADAELIPGGGAVSAAIGTDENFETVTRLLQELKRNPERLGGQELDPIRSANVDAALLLLKSIETDPAARRQFVLRLRAILNPSAGERGRRLGRLLHTRPRSAVHPAEASGADTAGVPPRWRGDRLKCRRWRGDRLRCGRWRGGLKRDVQRIRCRRAAARQLHDLF